MEGLRDERKASLLAEVVSVRKGFREVTLVHKAGRLLVLFSLELERQLVFMIFSVHFFIELVRERTCRFALHHLH